MPRHTANDVSTFFKRIDLHVQTADEIMTKVRSGRAALTAQIRSARDH